MPNRHKAENIAPGYNSSMSLGSRIGAARRRAGINKSELARRIGVNPSSAIEWEKGRKNPSTDHLIKIAVVTQTSFEWLATGRGDIAYTENKPDLKVAESAGYSYDALTEDEAAIIKAFRRMSEEKKKALLDFLA